MAARYSIPRVFVATDSPGVVEEFRGLVAGLEVAAVPDDLFDRAELEDSIHKCSRKHPHKTDDGTTLEDGCSGNDAWLEHRLGRGYIRGDALAMTTLLDVELMADADAFVGHFGSNLSRLAYMLMAARRRAAPPFTSLDGPWCYHWRMCCDVQAHGRSRVC
mmetsp:Transcript_23068/g.62511  ORF Transcript_23068/g.62511 Transcript_23068/m.62511 type:complete len:161 (+) Transcript_23068:197-679(+)